MLVVIGDEVRAVLDGDTVVQGTVARIESNNTFGLLYYGLSDWTVDESGPADDEEDALLWIKPHAVNRYVILKPSDKRNEGPRPKLVVPR